jgi:hypothetical protein
MSKQAVREFDKEYHPPETLYLNYCAAVLAVVLKQHPKAKELYQDIKDCFMLPGVEDTFSMIERKVPEGTELLKGWPDMVADGVKQVDVSTVKAYARDLRSLIEDSTFTERKAFLRSFVKKIVVGPKEVTV